MSRPVLEPLDVGWMLSEEPPPVPWLVDGLIARGMLTMLTGLPGQGKSLVSLALAAGVARGETVAGLRCRSGRALVVDAEQGIGEIHRRVRGLGVPPRGVDMLAADGLDLGRDLGALQEALEDRRPDVLILDSWRSLWRGDENDPARVSAVLDPLRNLVRHHDVGTLLLHHVGKATGTYRGTTATGASVELGFILARAEEDPDRARRVLRCWKCRPATEPPPRWLRIEERRDLEAVLVERADAFKKDSVVGRPPKAHKRVEEQVLEMLGDGDMTLGQLAAALGRTPKDGTVRRVLDALASAGRVEKAGNAWRLVPGVPEGPEPLDG